MTEVVDALAAGTAGWLAGYLLHSTLLLGGAWVLVRSRVVRGPAGRDMVWKVALLGGMVTATAATVVRPALRAEPPGMRLDMHEPAPGWSARGGVDPLRAPAAERLPGETRHLAVRARVTDPSPECRAVLRSPGADRPAWVSRVSAACAGPSGPRWYAVVASLWMLGALLGAARLVTRTVRLRRALRPLAPASPRVRDALVRLRKEAGLPAVRVVTSASLSTPAVVGARTIGLPHARVEALGAPGLKGVLAHEAAHIVRRDPLWLALFHLVGAVLWIQPLNRTALRGFLSAAEHACDDWAAGMMDRPIAMARTLAQVASWALPGQSDYALAMSRGDGTSVRERVARILSGADRSRPRWRAALVAVALVVPLPFLPALPRVARRTAVVVVEEVVRAGTHEPGDPPHMAVFVGRGEG